MAGRPRTRSGSYQVSPRQRAAGYRRRLQRLASEWAVAQSADQRLAAAVRAMSAMAAQPPPGGETDRVRDRVLDEVADYLRRGVHVLATTYEKEVNPKK